MAVLIGRQVTIHETELTLLQLETRVYRSLVPHVPHPVLYVPQVNLARITPHVLLLEHQQHHLLLLNATHHIWFSANKLYDLPLKYFTSSGSHCSIYLLLIKDLIYYWVCILEVQLLLYQNHIFQILQS